MGSRLGNNVVRIALAGVLAAGMTPTAALAAPGAESTADVAAAASAQQAAENQQTFAQPQVAQQVDGVSLQSTDLKPQGNLDESKHISINLSNNVPQSCYVPYDNVLSGIYTIDEPSIVYFTATFTGTDGEDSASALSFYGTSLDFSNSLFQALTYSFQSKTITVGPFAVPAGTNMVNAFWPQSCLGTVTLSYSATPAGCDNVESEYNNRTESATPITPNTPYRGSLFYDHDESLSDDFFKSTCDRDYYRLDLDKATNVAVKLTGEGPIDVQLVNAEDVVYNQNAAATGTALSMTTSSQDGSTYLGDLSCGTLPAGTYYVKVTPNTYKACNKLYDITVATSDPGAKQPDAAIIDKTKQDLADANNDLTDALQRQKDAQQAYDEAVNARDNAIADAHYDAAAIARGSAGFFEWAGASNAQYIVEHPEAASGLSDTHTNLGADGDATSLDNMRLAQERMQYVNYYRGLEGLGDLYVYDTIMAQGQIQCNFGAQEMDHAGNHGSKFRVAENLSWGYRNPFDGWYTKEKATYDSAIAAGVQPDYWQVGHYLNIVDTNNLFYGCGTNTNAPTYGICDEQAFDSGYQYNNLKSEEQLYTANAYYTRFMRYYNKVHGEVDQSYQTEVDNAKANLDYATASVTAANAAIVRAQDEIARAEAGKTPVRRICGEEASDTAVAISKKAFPDGADTVVLARDDDFADAMSATGLAGALNAPILLVSPEYGMSVETIEEIERLGAKNAYIVGGPGAIKSMDAVYAWLGHTGISSPVNLYGNDAADTSAVCAAEIARRNAADGVGTPYSVVAMSDNFQDALSMSSFAYAHRAPIVLLTSSPKASGRQLTDESAALLKDGALAGSNILVAGGTGAVKTKALTDRGLKIYKRLAGNDGYDTSNQIANWMVAQGLLSADSVTFACGAEPAKGLDALAGAALAGKEGGVMLLTSTQPDYGDAREVTVSGKDSEGGAAFLEGHAASVQWVDVLGGTYVMPESFINNIKDTLG